MLPELDGHLQCGIDLVEVSRIRLAVQRWGDRFLHRVWTQGELDYCRGRFPELAARFAVKEAAAKALGTGLTGIVWREIEVARDDLGKPFLVLHGAALKRAESLGLQSWAISLSHTGDLACAVAVASSHR